MHSGAAPANFACGFDEVHRVATMLVDPGSNRKDVGIEDDILRIAAVSDEQPIGTLADRDLAVLGVGLTGLIESHAAQLLHEPGKP